MVTWVLFLGIGLIIGVVAGLYFGKLDDVSNRQKKKLQDQLDQAQNELGAYKTQVTDHFLKTSVLINQMSASYKAVHAHLADGADLLCDSHVIVNQLDVEDSKLIKVDTESGESSNTSPVQAAEEEVIQHETPTVSAVEGIEGRAPTEQSSTQQAEQADTLTEDVAKEVKSQEAELQPVEPPSTPESLPLEDKDVDSNAAPLSDADKASAPFSNRTVH